MVVNRMSRTAEVESVLLSKLHELAGQLLDCIINSKDGPDDQVHRMPQPGIGQAQRHGQEHRQYDADNGDGGVLAIEVGLGPRLNGRRDLLRRPPDVLASTANFLAGHGWQKGKDWEPGSANFAVIKEWNKSEVYAKTIGSFATQLSRAP